MPAYLIADVSVRDRAKLIEYLELANGTVEAFEGRYLAQAGAISVLEGDWQPETIVVVEFPTADAAKAWYTSEAYEPALQMNSKAMIRRMIVVEGL